MRAEEKSVGPRNTDAPFYTEEELDLKHVVERLIRSRFPAVSRVENVY